MAKKKEIRPERLNLTLTPQQTEKFNKYIIKVGERQGRIPAAIKTKILRKALDEWLEHYGNDFDIDWNE
jgi:hypothetical protein